MSEYSPQEQAAYDIGFKIGKSLGATSAEFNANSKAKWTRAYQHQIDELIKENEQLRQQLAAEREKHKAELVAAEQSGFKRGLTFVERNQKTGEILVRYDEERK